MLIFDEHNDTVIVESIYVPIPCESFWVLDLELMDFTLAPLDVLEEVVCPSIQLMIGGFKFVLPANWNMLVFDPDTSQLDVVEMSDLSSNEFTAFVYGPNKSSVSPLRVATIDYLPSCKNISPTLNKHQMLCHPISPDAWVVVSSSDGYNKYLKDCVVGDII